MRLLGITRQIGFGVKRTSTVGAVTDGLDFYGLKNRVIMANKMKRILTVWSLYVTGDEEVKGRCCDVELFRFRYPCAFVAIGDNEIRKQYAKKLIDAGFLFRRSYRGMR